MMIDGAVLLVTEAETRARTRAMLDSREWWVIPWLTAAAAEVSLAIERRYYAGEASADFEALLGPMLVTAGRKKRMSPEQLGELMAEECPRSGKSVAQWTAICRDQDILVALRSEDDVDGMGAVLLWLDWLSDGWGEAMAATGPVIERPCGFCGAPGDPLQTVCPVCADAESVTVGVHPFVTLGSAYECLGSLKSSLGIISSTDKIKPAVGTPAYYWDGADEALRSLFQQLVVMLPEEYERTEGDATRRSAADHVAMRTEEV